MTLFMDLCWHQLHCMVNLLTKGFMIKKNRKAQLPSFEVICPVYLSFIHCWLNFYHFDFRYRNQGQPSLMPKYYLFHLSQVRCSEWASTGILASIVLRIYFNKYSVVNNCTTKVVYETLLELHMNLNFPNSLITVTFFLCAFYSRKF